MYNSDLVQVDHRPNSIDTVWQEVKKLPTEEKAEIVKRLLGQESGLVLVSTSSVLVATRVALVSTTTFFVSAILVLVSCSSVLVATRAALVSICRISAATRVVLVVISTDLASASWALRDDNVVLVSLSMALVFASYFRR